MKASLGLPPSSLTSKVDDRSWTHELWLAAYRQARAQIRDRRNSTAASAYVWCLGHLRRRFGPAGWAICQAAASLVFDRRIVSGAATGSIADLERQGLIRPTRRPRRGNLVGMVPYRCVTLERVRGINFAWGGDELACVNRRVALRRCRARELREERRKVLAEVRAEERQVALLMAQDRFMLTEKGLAALRAAGMT